MNEYYNFLSTYEFYKELNEIKSTKKNSIAEFTFYKIYEILFLMTLFTKKQFPKIFGFIANQNHSCMSEKYKENQKICIINNEFNSKLLLFYQFKNCLESLLHLANSLVENSYFCSERFMDVIEILFNSYVNISFKPSFNSIKLIIIGELKTENLYIYNFINNEKRKFVYKFRNILFILSFDYYYCRKNDGTRIVKIKLKIYFPEKYKYSSYFTSFIEKHMNKYLIKKYDCNRILRDILSKRQKFVFIYESKKKYNLSIFLTIIQKEYIEFIKFIEESKKLSNTKIVRIYNTENKLLEDFQNKKIEETESSELCIALHKLFK